MKTRSLLRWARRAALFLVMTLLVGVLAAAGLLYTETGSTFAARRALAWYGGQIAGAIEVEEISGRLADRFELRGVVLRDALGAPLATIERLRLDWHALALLRREVNVDALTITGLDVHAPDPAGGGFAALAPASEAEIEAEPVDPDAPLGPDIPLRYRVTVHLDGVRVQGPDRATLANLDRLSVRLTGRGREAALTVLEGRGGAPQANLKLLALEATWRSPEVFVESLRLVTDRGRLDVERARIDVRMLAGEADLRLRVPPDIDLAVGLKGALSPQIDLHAALVGRERVVGRGEIHVSGRDLNDLTVQAALRCEDCRVSPLGPVDARLAAAILRGTGRGTLHLEAAGAIADLEARVAGGERALVTWRAGTPALAELLRHFPDLPPVDAAVESTGRCDGAIRAPRCETQVDLRALRAPQGRVEQVHAHVRLAPLARPLRLETEVEVRGARSPSGTIDFASAAAELVLGPPHRIDLRALDGRAQGRTVHLLAPARVVVDPRAVAIEDLRLRALGARFALDGRLALEGPSDVELGVAGLELASLPGSQASGRASVDARLSGTLQRPQLRATGAVQGLRVRQGPPGEGRFSADLRGGRAQATLELRGGLAQRLSVAAEAPLKIDLERGVLTPGAGRAQVDVRVGALDLDALRTLVPALPLRGVVDATGAFQGSLRAPEGQLTLHGAGLAFEDKKLGDLDVAARYGDGRASAELRLTGGAARRILAEVSAPVKVDLAAGRVDLPRGGLKLNADVIGVELAGLELYRPGLGLDGQADARLRASGSLETPDINLWIGAKGLVWRGARWGDAALTAESGEGRVVADLGWTGGPAGALTGHVEAPLAVGRAGLVWDRAGPHRVAVDAKSADVSAMLRPLALAPRDLALTTDLAVRGEGTAETFRVDANGRGTVAHGALGPTALSFEARVDPARQVARLSAGEPFRLDATVETRAPLAGKAPAGLAEGLAARTPLEGRVVISRAALAALGPFLPISLYGPEGSLDAHVRASGMLAAPDLEGALSIRDGAITVVPLNQRLKDIEVGVRLRDRVVDLHTLDFRSGRGRAKGEGRAVLGAGGSVGAAAALSLYRFPVVVPGVPHGIVSTRVTATAARIGNDADLHVKLTRSEVRLTGAKSRAPRPVPKSEAVVFIDREGLDEAARRRAREAEEPGRTSIVVDLAEPVLIRGTGGVDMRWGGKVAVTREGAVNAVKGALEARAGRVTVLGNVFEIDHAEVTIPAGAAEIDPFVTAEAHTDTPEGRVVATIRGPVSRPELKFSSDPPMPEYQILTLLVTGSSDRDEQKDTEVQDQALGLLAAIQNPALERQVNERLGIDRIGVSFGETSEEPILTVGKQLTRKLYVETRYHHNAPPEENLQEVRVEYLLAPRWTVESFYGDSGQGGVDLFWALR